MTGLLGKIAPPGIAAFCGLGLTAALQPASAQAAPASPQHVRGVITLPGRGPTQVDLIVAPSSCVRKIDLRQRGHSRSFITGQPMLFSSESEYVAGDGADNLWQFPTLGYDPTHMNIIPVNANTGEANAPSNLNTTDVALGQIGAQAIVNQVVVPGGILSPDQNGNLLPTDDSLIAIVFYKGVDQQTPPRYDLGQTGAPANVARLEDGVSHGYIFPFNGPASFGYYQFDVSSLPKGGWVIDSAQGKFGLLVTKFSDNAKDNNGNYTFTHTHPNSQWYWGQSAVNGPNATWQFKPGSNFRTTNSTPAPPANILASTPADSNFVQTATTNHMFELHGINLDHSPAATGTLRGNIRRRGINPPANLQPETKPGRYYIAAYQAGTNTLVREDWIFTQPSYDGSGALTVNYILEGYPAGTYDFKIAQLPIYNASNQRDTIWSPVSYPHADYLPVLVKNISITNGGNTTVNARLERMGDFTDDGTLNQPDGYVDINDLGYFAFHYGTGDGTTPGIPGDIVSDGSIDGPDGFVDINDLGAFAALFGTGNFEQP